MTDKQKTRIRKNNMKIYPTYQMFGGDFMFYYAIRTLFLIQVKDIAASDVVLLSSIYAIASILFYIPALFIMKKIGKKNSVILGNGINVIFILIFIFSTGFEQLIIAQIFSALSDALRGTAASSLLKESIPKSEKGTDIYAKIEGKGYAKYAYFQAFSEVASGFLYDVNPYIPLVVCFITLVTTVIISSKFEEIEDKEDKEEKSIKETILDIKSGFVFIFKSKRLKALFLMLAAIWGLFSFAGTYMYTLFEDMGCTAAFIGAVSAIKGIAKGIASRKEKKFHKKYRNKSLTVLAEICAILLIVIGICSLLNIPFIVQIIIIILAFITLESMKGFYQILKKRYSSNFTNKNILPQILSASGICISISSAIGSFIASKVLGLVNIKIATIIMGIVCLIIFVAISKFMKPRVGLKADQYEEKDIQYK